jgi:hypothetical protein
MIRGLVLASLVLIGCAGDGAAAPAKEPPKVPAKPPVKEKMIVPASPVEWSMSKSADGASLAVNVKVANTTAGPIWVADRLIVPVPGNKFARTDRLTVMNTDDPKVVRFVVGAVSSDRPSAQLYGATFHKVEAGASIEHAYKVPLPLASWNPVGGANPLVAGAAQAKLFVHTSIAEPVGWTTLASSDAEPVKVPEWGRAQTILQGDAKPLP